MAKLIFPDAFFHRLSSGVSMTRGELEKLKKQDRESGERFLRDAEKELLLGTDKARRDEAREDDLEWLKDSKKK